MRSWSGLLWDQKAQILRSIHESERAYVTSETFMATPISVVDTEDLRLVASVRVGNNPFGVAADLLSGVVFVTNLTDHTISVINGKTNRVVKTVPVFGRFIDVNPATGLAYASDDVSLAIHVISEPRHENCDGARSESEEEDCD